MFITLMAGLFYLRSVRSRSRFRRRRQTNQGAQELLRASDYHITSVDIPALATPLNTKASLPERHHHAWTGVGTKQ
ncbi:uncharacterized protein P884DRAFT_254700 [Thermothelomyces heterothallicus CBS 202.75]|uniref:uncharacterized protein n=1 Tax=Thermothelomyces heterothallicus CBS 202.75 TaxID=1149848 RepID=UPI003742F825